MTVSYVACTPQTALALYPRAVYRVTLQRQGIASLVMAAGVVSWPDVVESVADAAARSPYGVALGYPPPSNQESSAVVEIRAEQGGGVSASVGDLVRVMDTASSFARVVRVERLAPVPIAGSNEERERTASREAETSAAITRAEESSVLARLQGALGTGKVVVGALAGAALIIGLLYLIGRARDGARAVSEGAK